MVPTDKASTYRASVAKDYGELSEFRTVWQFKSADSMTYVFSQWPHAPDLSRWYLTRIQGFTGHNRVDLTYAVHDIELRRNSTSAPGRVKEIVLAEVAYKG